MAQVSSPRSPYSRLALGLNHHVHHWYANFASCQSPSSSSLVPLPGAPPALPQRAVSPPTLQDYPSFAGPAHYAHHHGPHQSAWTSVSDYHRNNNNSSSSSYLGEQGFDAVHHYGGANTRCSVPQSVAVSSPTLTLTQQSYDLNNTSSAPPLHEQGPPPPPPPSPPLDDAGLVYRQRPDHVQHPASRANNAPLQLLQARLEVSGPTHADHHVQYGPSVSYFSARDNEECSSMAEVSAAQFFEPQGSVLPESSAVPRLLNHPPTSMPALEGPPAHTTMGWQHNLLPGLLPPTQSSHTVDHASARYASASANTSPDSLCSSSDWSIGDADPLDAISPSFSRAHDVPPVIDAGWTLLPPNVARPLPHAPSAYMAPYRSPLPPPHAAALRLAPPPDVYLADSRTNGKRATTRKDKAAKIASSFAPRAIKTKISKRSGQMTDEAKANATLMRKIGTCDRCRFYKSKCSPGLPCNECRKKSDNSRVWGEPCCRGEPITSAILVRHCNARFGQLSATFRQYNLISNRMLDMDVVWNLPGFGPLPQPLRVRCAEYDTGPQDLDTTTTLFRDDKGQIREVVQAPYAAADANEFRLNVAHWLGDIMPYIENALSNRMRNDDLAVRTLFEAMRLRDQGSELLRIALRIACLSCLAQGYGTVMSDNVPGLREYDFRRMGSSDYEAYNRNSKNRPLPTALNHQWDVAILDLLKHLETKFRRLVDEMIFKTGTKHKIPWYELFLALFVTLSNMEYIRSSAERYIKSKEGTVFAVQVRHTVTAQIADWGRSIPIILRHVRYTLRGDFKPFKLARENPEELRLKGWVDHAGFRYIMDAIGIIDRKGLDRYYPPTTTPLPTTSDWVRPLFHEAGALP